MPVIGTLQMKKEAQFIESMNCVSSIFDRANPMCVRRLKLVLLILVELYDHVLSRSQNIKLTEMFRKYEKETGK